MSNQQIEQFFANYEKLFNDALNGSVDIKKLTSLFASDFVGASPKGVHGGKNGWFFRMMIPRGYAFYRKIGTKSMKITKPLEITQLDDFHFMVKVHWDSRYAKKDGQEEKIEFDNIYFLQILKDEPKIFAYVTGDEQKVLKERGIV